MLCILLLFSSEPFSLSIFTIMASRDSDRMYTSTDPESKGILIARKPFMWEEIVRMNSNKDYGLGR